MDLKNKIISFLKDKKVKLLEYNVFHMKNLKII